MIPIQLSKRIRIIPDIKATAFDSKAITGAAHGLGANFSGTLGLQVALGKIKKKQPVVVPPVSPAYPEPVEEEPVVAEEPKVEESPVDKKYIEEIEQKEEEINLSLSKVVLFAFDSYNLTDEAKGILDDVVDFVLTYPGLKLVVAGHTDSEGDDQYNVTLSNNRAKAVADYLTQGGIPQSDISSVGYGEFRPVDTNATKEGRAHNRRVEIHLDAETATVTIRR